MMKEECLASNGCHPHPEEHSDVVTAAGTHMDRDIGPSRSTSVSSTAIPRSLSQLQHGSLHTEYEGGSSISY